MVALVAFEGITIPATNHWRFWLAAISLACLAGMAMAIVLDLGLRRVPSIPKLGPYISPLIGISAGVGLARSLGVFQKLSGAYQGLAIATGCACLLGGLSLTSLIYVTQRPQAHTPSVAERWPKALRHGFGGALAVVAFGSIWVDRTLYVGLYPSAHIGLRLAASFTLSLAFLNIYVATPSFARNRAGRFAPRIVLFLAACSLPHLALSGPPAALALQAFGRAPLSGLLLARTRTLLDFDGDGYSAFLGGGDCDDNNRNVHPAAKDIPGNGIDENCFGGDAQTSQLATATGTRPTDPSPLNVVLITVDTVRWDRLGLNDANFGAAGKNTMPNISAFGAKGTNFTHAYSAGAWTSVSLPALLRGRYPRHLNWTPHFETTNYRMLAIADQDERLNGEELMNMFPLAWRDPQPTLAEHLRRRDMQTSAVVDDDFTLVLSPLVGTSKGFSRYREVQPGAARGVRSDDARTTQLALSELARMRRIRRPYFLWVHYFGPHGPSVRHPDVRNDGDTDTDGYDHEVRYADQQVGRLLTALEAELAHTAVFITSDHGEELHTKYRAHGTSLHEALIRVPLVARVPGWPNRTHDRLVSLVDLLPTILALTETPPPDTLDGEDLGPLLASKAPARKRILITDNWKFDLAGNALINSVAAYDGRQKVVLDRIQHTFSNFLQDDMQDRLDFSTWNLRSPLGLALLDYLESANRIGPLPEELTAPAVPTKEPVRPRRHRQKRKTTQSNKVGTPPPSPSPKVRPGPAPLSRPAPRHRPSQAR